MEPRVDEKDSSRKLRPTCPASDCGFILYENPVPVVAAIVQRGDEIVLVRNKSWPQSWFGLCTGFLEKGEHPLDAVQREVQEELGLRTESCSFLGMYPFPRLNQLIIAYHVIVDPDAAVVIDPIEIAEYRLVKILKLRPWAGGTGPPAVLSLSC